MEQSGPENRMSGSGAVSGSYRKRRERRAEISTAPAPLTCSALSPCHRLNLMCGSADVARLVKSCATTNSSFMKLCLHELTLNGADVTEHWW